MTPWYQTAEPEWSEYDIDIARWLAPKPFGISGCFRLRDEAEWMERAVESHLPYLDEAVLVVQESGDNTVELAHELKYRWFPKVRVVEYPVIPHFIDHPMFHTEPENSIYSFVYLSNWALSQCRYSWIAKTEGDVLCLSTFGKIVDEVRANPTRWQLYGRVILNVAGTDCDQISATNPRNGGWDECVIPNNPNMARFVRRSKWEVIDNSVPQVCMGFSALHMKRCKKEFLPVWNGETYVPFTRESVRETLTAFNSRNGYPAGDDPTGGEVVFEWDGKL